MFKFTVMPDGLDAYEAEATSRDVRRWEAAGKGRSVGRLGDNPMMVDMYSLAFLAVSRLGLFEGDIREFEASCDLKFKKADEDDEDDSGPTRPDR